MNYDEIKKELARQELHDLGVVYLTEKIIEDLRSRPDVDQKKVDRLAYLYDIVVDKPEVSQKELDMQQEIGKTKVIIDEYFKEVGEGLVPTFTVYLPKFFVEEVPSVLFETGGKGNWHGISTRLNNVLRGAWGYEGMRHIYDYLWVTAKELKKYYRQWGKVAITEFEQLLQKYGYSLACQDLSMFYKRIDGVEYVEIASDVLELSMFNEWLRVKSPKRVIEYISKRKADSRDKKGVSWDK